MKMRRFFFFIAAWSCVSLFAGNAGVPIFDSSRDAGRIAGAIVEEDWRAIWAMPISNANAEIASEKINGSELTITSWVAPLPHINDYRQIVFKGARGATSPHVDFKFGLFGLVPEFGYFNSHGEWCGIMRNHQDLVTPNGKRIPLKACPQAIPNCWNFCAVTFERGYIRLYLNDQIVAEGMAGGKTLVIKNTPLFIGAGQNSQGSASMFMNGLLRDIKIFNHAMSKEEVEAIRVSQLPDYPSKAIKIRKMSDLYADEYDPGFKKKLLLTADYESKIPPCDLPEGGSAYEVVNQDGIPRLARDGKVESGMCMMPACTADNNGVFLSVRDFAAAKVDYVSEIFWPWISWGGNCSQWWLGPGKYDFPKIEARLQKIVDGNPKARIIVRCKMNVPDWWLKKYPEELVLDSTGKAGQQPGLASKRWLTDTTQMLYDVTKHLENSKYAKHIAGYLVAGGETSEWFWWSYSTGKVDYSDSAKNAFRIWLTDKYGSDDKLRTAWGDATVTLSSACVPTPEERARTGKDGAFIELSVRQKVYDYRRFMSDQTSKCIIDAVHKVRSAMPVRKLIGTFYGYSMYIDHNSLANLGFQNLDQVLKCKEIDFLCAPLTYISRRGGEEGNYICEYTASLRLHNKIYWDEADMRTHLHPLQINCKTETPEETSEVNWRTFGNSLVQGTNIWWFLIAGNSVFHSERIMREISDIARLDKELLEVPRRRSARIAVICDERSMEFTTGQTFLDQYIVHTMTKLPKVGAPYDTYLMSDLKNPSMPDYDLYIFLNAYYADAKKRAVIHEKLSRNHAAALWLYAPGYLSPEGDSTEQMKKLTGITFSSELQRGRMIFNAKLSPVKNKWGTSYYSFAPLTPELVRDICRRENIHIFIESNDILRANSGFIMVHATHAGKKQLKFPHAVKLKNLKNGAVLEPGKTLEIQLKHGETALFQIIQE